MNIIQLLYSIYKELLQSYTRMHGTSHIKIKNIHLAYNSLKDWYFNSKYLLILTYMLVSLNMQHQFTEHFTIHVILSSIHVTFYVTLTLGV
jgi:hypothetical protein